MNDQPNSTVIKQGPEVSIVILNWNGRSFLEKFLPSVLASTYPNKRIIVADNASTDDSVFFVRDNFPGVELIVNSSNDGFANGYNNALKKVAGDYYVLLNSDVEVTPGWIEPIIHLMESDERIAVCQPKILSYHNKSFFEYAGASGGWIDTFGYPFSRGRVFEDCEKDTGQYDDARECFWAGGAAFFIKAPLYHSQGGLDGYFFAHQEEIDLCWRLKESGYKIYVEPHSVVYHVGGGTLPRGNSMKTFLNFRNNLIMMYKNLPWKEAIWKLPFRIMLNGVAAVKSIWDGDAGYFFAVAKGNRHFVKWMLFDKKRSVFPKNKMKIMGGVYSGSVVWDYFVKKKRTFSQIVGNK
ncbi:MAG TPA: glycosyltransferase family 2 protein [Ferruginibacter sp.]|nr:glycosyltransferase family 2 protein [Ferruginibacter sp.]